MKPDLNCFDPNSIELCFFCGLYFDFVLSPVFKYKALAGILSSSIWVLFQGRIFLAPTERKNITDLFTFERARFKLLIFLSFLSWRMQTLKRARNVWRLNSQKSQDGTFVHYPFFVLNILLITLFTYSYRNFFSDMLWQLARTHARDNTLDRDTIVRSKMTWLDAIFCRGSKSSSRSLARFCRGRHEISTARASRSWKNLSSTCRQV